MSKLSKKKGLENIAAELAQLDDVITKLDEWVYTHGRSHWRQLEPQVRDVNESILQIAMHLHDLGTSEDLLKRWAEKGVFDEKVEG
jgi:hypothetical protein